MGAGVRQEPLLLVKSARICHPLFVKFLSVYQMNEHDENYYPNLMYIELIRLQQQDCGFLLQYLPSQEPIHTHHAVRDLPFT
jgi:hypothetical protein